MADAGWYADPLGHAEYRYFDGQHWTDQVSTAGSVGTDPPVEAAPLTPAEDHPPPPTTAATSDAGPGGRRTWWLVAGGVVLVVIVAIVLVLVTGGDDDADDEAATTSAPAEEERATTTTTEAPATTTTESASDGGLTPEDDAACRYLFDEIDAPGGYDPTVVFPTVIDMATDGGEVEMAADQALTSFVETGSVGAAEAAELTVACGSALL